jgi:hypothetical protein
MTRGLQLRGHEVPGGRGPAGTVDEHEGGHGQ